MSRAAALLALALALAGGCGAAAATDPNIQALHDLEAAVRAVDRALGVQTAFVAAGAIDDSAPADVVAQSLVGRLQSEAAGCVQASRTDTVVDANFGPSCALATAGMHVGGTASAAVQAAAGQVTVRLTLALTVDGQVLSGTFDVSTSDGDGFGYAGALTLDGTVVTAPRVQAGIAGGAARLTAMNGAVGTTPLSVAAVHQRFSACYPDDGTATLGAIGVTFGNHTPQTGDALLTAGSGAPRSIILPPRTRCPPQP